MDNTVYLYSLCFSFVEALVPTISGIYYEHLFRTTVSVPPNEAELFPVLPRLIMIWSMFLRRCLWKNNRTSSKLFDISVSNTALYRIEFCQRFTQWDFVFLGTKLFPLSKYSQESNLYIYRTNNWQGSFPNKPTFIKISIFLKLIDPILIINLILCWWTVMTPPQSRVTMLDMERNNEIGLCGGKPISHMGTLIWFLKGLIITKFSNRSYRCYSVKITNTRCLISSYNTPIPTP